MVTLEKLTSKTCLDRGFRGRTTTQLEDYDPHPTEDELNVEGKILEKYIDDGYKIICLVVVPLWKKLDAEAICWMQRIGHLIKSGFHVHLLFDSFIIRENNPSPTGSEKDKYIIKYKKLVSCYSGFTTAELSRKGIFKTHYLANVDLDDIGGPEKVGHATDHLKQDNFGLLVNPQVVNNSVVAEQVIRTYAKVKKIRASYKDINTYCGVFITGMMYTRYDTIREKMEGIVENDTLSLIPTRPIIGYGKILKEVDKSGGEPIFGEEGEDPTIEGKDQECYLNIFKSMDPADLDEIYEAISWKEKRNVTPNEVSDFLYNAYTSAKPTEAESDAQRDARLAICIISGIDATHSGKGHEGRWGVATHYPDTLAVMSYLLYRQKKNETEAVSDKQTDLERIVDALVGKKKTESHDKVPPTESKFAYHESTKSLQAVIDNLFLAKLVDFDDKKGMYIAEKECLEFADDAINITVDFSKFPWDSFDPQDDQGKSKVFGDWGRHLWK